MLTDEVPCAYCGKAHAGDCIERVLLNYRPGRFVQYGPNVWALIVESTPDGIRFIQFKRSDLAVEVPEVFHEQVAQAHGQTTKPKK